MSRSQTVRTTVDESVLVRRHLQFAWWSLLCFLTLGIMLEAMHGLKVGWYLESAFQTRRLMLTLGHAHGTLLALVHAMFAASVFALPVDTKKWRRWASPCLMGASVLLPSGFFLGGIFIYDGDPGLGIFLVPLGASFLFVGVFLAALAVTLNKPPVEIGADDRIKKKRGGKIKDPSTAPPQKTEG